MALTCGISVQTIIILRHKIGHAFGPVFGTIFCKQYRNSLIMLYVILFNCDELV